MINLHGFLQTSSFSTGIANDKHTSVVCDDFRTDDASINLYCLEGGRGEKVGNTVEMAFLDVEMTK